MGFPKQVRDEALIACGRHCSICHRFCGLKMELHHIKQVSKGGNDSFTNCIPLCFDCHADMRSYDHGHPKGTKYTPTELRRHRDRWYEKVRTSGGLQAAEPVWQDDRALFDEIKKLLRWDYEIDFLKRHDFGASFEEAKVENIHALLHRSGDPQFEFLDSDLEGLRAELIAAVREFCDAVARYVFVSENREDVMGVPKEWRRTAEKDYRVATSKLNTTATKIVTMYSALVKACRRRLARPG